MARTPYQQLSQEDVDHFMHHGWIKIPSCFTQEQVDKLTSTLWTRLGMSPVDKTTWNTERIHMPSHTDFLASDFAPKAWSAICDLLDGEERISEEKRTWNDGFIVNLGTPEGEGKDVEAYDLPGWHVDGDFFAHYLDSPEQALLVIPLFTDIKPGGGGTFICPDAIPKIAKHLYDHPDGVSPFMVPRTEDPKMEKDKSLDFFCDIARSMPKDSFIEVTGKVGDVYLLHPLMLHSASNNKLRQLRVITNPPVSLRQPFQFSREDFSSYSIVERKTLAALGKRSLDGWKITHERHSIIPERLKRQERMKLQEEARLHSMGDQREAQVS